MPLYLLPADPISSLAEYLETDTGGAGLARAQDLGPAATIEEVSRSGLRGRGGGGFPTGRKWAGIASQPGTQRYLVCNGAEGEPGTFKDRALLRANPYQFVEGLIIAAHAIDAAQAYVCLKASFEQEIEAVTNAVAEFQTAGLCPGCEVIIVAGPDEYLYGEEKAMLEVIEGNDPLPRWLPPYIHGLFATTPQMGWQAHELAPGEAAGSHPTLVNNVETLSNVTHVLANGAEWFRTMGTDESPGNVVATVVGDVATPGVAEIELGTPLRTVIDTVGGGVRPGRTVKAVFSGVANAVVQAEQLDTPVSYEALAAIGSGMGSVGFIVYDDTACMVSTALQFSRFLYVESCGQCPPCKLGSGAITSHLEAIEDGTGTDADLDGIAHWLNHVADGNRCYLAVEEQVMVSSVLRAFPEEFARHLETGVCPQREPRPFPKLIDIADGLVTVDERHAHKRPDWTYEP